MIDLVLFTEPALFPSIVSEQVGDRNEGRPTVKSDQSGPRENRRRADRDGYRSMVSREISAKGAIDRREGGPEEGVSNDI